VAAALVTGERILTLIAGLRRGIWTSGLWEAVMIALLVGAGALVIAGFFIARSKERPAVGELAADPPFVRFLFSDARTAPLWLVIRLYAGFIWLQAGYGKLIGTEGDWMRHGTALERFWMVFPVLQSKGQHPNLAYRWWYDLLRFMLLHGWYTWFAKVIAIAETSIGIGLILGLLVGIAALCGATLNFSYLLTGSAGLNPVLLVFELAMVAGWKVAGYFGTDGVLLPRVRLPWQSRQVQSTRLAPGIIRERRDLRGSTSTRR
jgi:thiosulfate dehydrogenase [quinone] large subunit